MNNTTSISLMESNQIYIEQLEELLNSHDAFQVISSTKSSTELLSSLASTLADVVIINLSFPVLKTLDTVKSIRKSFGKGVKIVISNISNHLTVVKELETAGADVLLDKDSSSDHLLKVLYDISSEDVNPCCSFNGTFQGGQDLGETRLKLTNREVSICRLICRGKSCPEIARELFISIRTVENHKANIFRKMEVNSCTQMMEKAIIEGYYFI